MAAMRGAEIIIGEGITEKYYFLSLRDVLATKPTPIVLKPYNITELERAIKSYAADGYTKIYCLVDMDNKTASPNREKYQRLKAKYHAKRVGRTDCKVYFCESHPSIELFFYYYFEMSTAEKGNDELKSWLEHKFGYDVSEKYFIKNSLHGTMINKGGCLQDAISNAKNSMRLRDGDNYNCSYTELGDLIETLGLK